MRDGSTEYAIFTSFHLGMFAKRPLGLPEFLANPDFPIPVSFYYGDRDWMDKKSGKMVVRENKF